MEAFLTRSAILSILRKASTQGGAGMGLFDKLRGEFVDIIEWVDDSANLLVWRFPRYANEIKNGARLIVRPGQMAVFVNQGSIADTFEPGQYTLETKNLPILSTLQGWKFGFASPFKAEVYFISTRQITGLKWGTPNPVMLRDPDFGPIRLRAYGIYNLQAVQPVALLKALVAAQAEFSPAAVAELVRGMIVTAFSEVVGSSHIAAMDLAGDLGHLSDQVRKLVCDRIDDEYGLDLPQLLIVNVSLPEEVAKAIDTRSSMGVIGDMQRFAQYQMGKATLAAAENPSGVAGAGMALGAGLAVGQQFMAQQVSSPQPPPPPGAVGASFHISRQGQSLGPLNFEQLREAATRQELTPATWVWSAGMAGWVQASQVPALANLFGPPMPPPA
jgi:membrane protease subunit (stomatin/prohibitin family)